MAQTSIERGVDLWCKIAQDLNQVIVKTGTQIQIDNHRLWKNTFYPLTDQDWLDILAAFYHFDQQHGDLVQLSDKQAFDEAQHQLDQYWGVLQGDGPGFSCMNYKDRRRHKGGMSTKFKSWRMAMVLREVYCRACDIDLPNK
jgi:hypothetical protein